MSTTGKQSMQIFKIDELQIFSETLHEAGSYMTNDTFPGSQSVCFRDIKIVCIILLWHLLDINDYIATCSCTNSSKNCCRDGSYPSRWCKRRNWVPEKPTWCQNLKPFSIQYLCFRPWTWYPCISKQQNPRLACILGRLV